ncbi:MAG TPA: LEPR-XLL domain-containing protein [Thermoguttaceae bacterium]|nr:LEPR-XLL domain-containing protein [Thermoguttaceae bacterium]
MKSKCTWDRNHPCTVFRPELGHGHTSARSRRLRLETLEPRVVLSAVVGQYVLYDHSAFDTDAASGDGVPDLIIGPDGLTLDTDGTAILGYDIRSSAGILTGQPAANWAPGGRTPIR